MNWQLMQKYIWPENLKDSDHSRRVCWLGERGGKIYPRIHAKNSSVLSAHKFFPCFLNLEHSFFECKDHWVLTISSKLLGKLLISFPENGLSKNIGTHLDGVINSLHKAKNLPLYSELRTNQKAWGSQLWRK